MSAARSLLERALKLAPEDDKLHVRIAVELAEQLLEAGDAARVDLLLAIAERDPEVETSAAPIRLQWLIHARPQEAADAFRTRLPGLLERLAAAGDELGLAKAHLVAAHRYGLASCATEMAQEVRLAAWHAHQGGDEGLRCRALAWSVWALILGPSNPDEMSAGLDEVQREGQGAFVQAWVELGRGEVERLRGDIDETREWARRTTETFAALGNAMEFRGWRLIADAALLQGDLSAAMAALEHADTILSEAGQHTFRSTVQAQIADVAEQLGDREGALAAIQLCLTLSAQEDVINYVMTDTVRSRLALADGDAERAQEHARSAIRHASVTDFPVFKAAAYLQLARALSALGRPNEAAGPAQDALELSERKGDQAGIGAARGLLDRL
jgi:tetratricopeptide (TPR) repeat protein